MRTTLTLFFFFFLLAGCSSVPFERYVTLEVVIAGEESHDANGFSVEQALRMFEELTDTLGYVRKGPIRDPAIPVDISCSARPKGKLANKVIYLYLRTRIAEKKAFISTSVYGAEEDLVLARQLLIPFKEALETRNVRYTEYSGYSPFAP